MSRSPARTSVPVRVFDCAVGTPSVVSTIDSAAQRRFAAIRDAGACLALGATQMGSAVEAKCFGWRKRSVSVRSGLHALGQHRRRSACSPGAGSGVATPFAVLIWHPAPAILQSPIVAV